MHRTHTRNKEQHQVCTRSLAITVLRAPCRNPASRHSRCSAKASASGLAGADGPEPTRGARAHAPQPRSIAWGKVQEKQRRTLLVRVFWKGSGNGSSDVVISPPEAGGCCPRWPRKCVPKLRSNLRPKFCGKKQKGDRRTTREFQASSQITGNNFARQVKRLSS